MEALNHMRRPLSDLYRYQGATFVLFLCAGFLISPNPVWAFFFYTVVGPLTLWALWKDQHRSEYLRDPAALLGFAVIAWFCMTLLWGENQSADRVIKYVNAGLMNALFLAGGLTLFFRGEEIWCRRLVTWLPMAATCNALISMVLFYGIQGQELGVRLTGWAETRHSILGSDIMAVTVVLSLFCILSSSNVRERFFYSAMLIPQSLFIFLAGSRGPLLAVICALAIFLGLLGWRSIAAFIIGAGVLIGIGCSIPAAREFVNANLSRPPMRLPIWKDTLEQVIDNPLLGHGVANESIFANIFSFPHSLYFSALYYGGILGILVLISFMAVLLIRAWNSNHRPFLISLLSVPAIAGLTDLGQAIKSPSEEWFILWLPALIVAAKSHPAIRSAPLLNSHYMGEDGEGSAFHKLPRLVRESRLF